MREVCIGKTYPYITHLRMLGRFIKPSPFFQLVNPLIQIAIIIIRGNPDNSAGTMNKKSPKMPVAFFRHIYQHLSVTTAVLARNQTKPVCKATTIFKFSSFANRGNNCSGRFRTNTFNFGNALTGFGLCEYNIYLFIKKGYTATRVVKEIIEFCNRSTHSGAQSIFCILGDQWNGTTNS